MNIMNVCTSWIQFSCSDVATVNIMAIDLDEFSDRGKELKGCVG
jgi:hypothetical protein